jgi:hypothetical protein
MKKMLILCVALALIGATETSAESMAPKSIQGVPATKLKAQCDQKGGVFTKFTGGYGCNFPSGPFGYFSNVQCHGNPPKCSETRVREDRPTRSRKGGNVRVD